MMLCKMSTMLYKFLIQIFYWIPAFAGMTRWYDAPNRLSRAGGNPVDAIDKNIWFWYFLQERHLNHATMSRSNDDCETFTNSHHCLTYNKKIDTWIKLIN